ncbi:BolA protein family transcriptional regulator [Paraperlucidibaca baekdonensis]|uniref:BolA protein family transcriptional regulator n=1 Tax=Paraperlucidibaca baekdonensis TaxID=748120 RepID=A0A3E0H7W4_9GAMM|nr:BolA family protein [Paraperlucidibaca baekdonensis]REH38886.1 BolA protein family transcriptional regulator [Paraperlucidibaca baekdonensis]
MSSFSAPMPSGDAASAPVGREQRLATAVREALAPTHLEVINESHNHGGSGTETHYKLIAVSAAFEGQRAVARHQRVYALTAAERETGLHALALHLYTPDEWAAVARAPDSPACRGGSQ